MLLSINILVKLDISLLFYDATYKAGHFFKAQTNIMIYK